MEKQNVQVSPLAHLHLHLHARLCVMPGTTPSSRGAGAGEGKIPKVGSEKSSWSSLTGGGENKQRRPESLMRNITNLGQYGLYI
jgi:hypothetical protein